MVVIGYDCVSNQQQRGCIAALNNPGICHPDAGASADRDQRSIYKNLVLTEESRSHSEAFEPSMAHGGLANANPLLEEWHLGLFGSLKIVFNDFV